MPKTMTLADMIADRVEVLKPKTWLDRLPSDARTELDGVRSRFQAGGYSNAPALAVSRALLEVAAENGWKLLSEKELAKWLRS